MLGKNSYFHLESYKKADFHDQSNTLHNFIPLLWLKLCFAFLFPVVWVSTLKNGNKSPIYAQQVNIYLVGLYKPLDLILRTVEDWEAKTYTSLFIDRQAQFFKNTGTLHAAVSSWAWSRIKVYSQWGIWDHDTQNTMKFMASVQFWRGGYEVLFKNAIFFLIKPRQSLKSILLT